MDSYTKAEIERLKALVERLKGYLAVETNPAKRTALENEIRGYENTISGKYN